MVLPRGLEPPTSPLPRECSTTELRQHLQMPFYIRRAKVVMCLQYISRPVTQNFTLYPLFSSWCFDPCSAPQLANIHAFCIFSGSVPSFSLFSPPKFPYFKDKAGRMSEKTGNSAYKAKLADRRAEALRANLRRRKEQSSARQNDSATDKINEMKDTQE